MYISFNGIGHLEIDDKTDILNINTTPCKISSNQHI